MGDADGMVSGSASPTSNVLKATIQMVEFTPGVKTVSSVLLWNLAITKICLVAF